MSKHGNTATDVYGPRESAINSGDQPEIIAFRVGRFSYCSPCGAWQHTPRKLNGHEYVCGGLRWFDSTLGHDCVRLDFFSRRQPSRIQDSLDDT
jgi:hypothetical protein